MTSHHQSTDTRASGFTFNETYKPPESLEVEALLPVSYSVWDLLEREKPPSVNSHQTRGITTGSEAFDEILGGSGIPLSGITEVCGLPGIGKTQLA